MKKILQLVLLLNINLLFSQGNGNVQNEIGVTNTQIFYLDHKFLNDLEPGDEFFKPYLSYKKENGTYTNDSSLMDSFILYDSYFVNNFYHREGDYVKPYNGEYETLHLQNYRENLFKKAKVPIFINEPNSLENKVALLGNNKSSTLIYEFNVNNSNSTFNLNFRIKAPDYIGVNNDTLWGENYVGIQFMNEFNDLLEPDPDSAYGMSFDNIDNFLDITSNNWYSRNLNEISIPNGTHKIKIFIINYHSGIDFFGCQLVDGGECIQFQNAPSVLYVDDVKISLDNSGQNILPTPESDFTVNPILSNWQFVKKYNKNLRFLFNDRAPLLDHINEANNQLNSKRIKIIPILPSIRYDFLLNNEAEIKQRISDYIDNVVNDFNTWKALNSESEPKIELYGMYFVDESIEGFKETNLMPILTYIKNKLAEDNMKLLGSPYFSRNDTLCNFKTSFGNNTISLFDVVYQQPNSFFKDFNDTENVGRDQELLRMANELASFKRININIENRVLEENEIYGRVNDYFSYGDKYGYINYSKMYYDDSGAHYLNANSDIPDERIDYDNLYKFIKKSNKGVVINNKFEMNNKYSNSLLYNWSGDYQIKKHSISKNYSRILEVEVNNNLNVYSDFIPIKNGENCKVSLKAREITNDLQSNSALIGVKFYDNNNNEITSLVTGSNSETNLKYSSYLGHYYIYLNTNTIFKDFNFYFKPPSNSVKFKFYLKKWETSNLIFKNLKLIESNNINELRTIYKNSNSNILYVDTSEENGNHSLLLDYNKYAHTSEQISIKSNKTYQLKLVTREELPLNSSSRQNKALIAIKTFKANGTEFNAQISGWDYSSSLGMRYKYIDNINQTWTDYSTLVNFPDDVASVTIHFQNWYYQNNILIDNIILKTFDLETVTSHSENLLNNDNWNEKTPLTVSHNAPVLYEDFIDVENYSKLSFSALMRDSETNGTNNDLLAIEFYDENYDILAYDDIAGLTNFSWSSTYKYWWDNYFSIITSGCSNNIDWAENKWNLYNREIDFPPQVKHIKLSFHKLTQNDEEFLILNPKLLVLQERGHSNLKTNKQINNKSNTSTIQEDIYVYPNPAKDALNIVILNTEKKKNYTIDLISLDGKILKTVYTNDQNIIIDVSMFASGFYLIKATTENKSLIKKFLIE